MLRKQINFKVLVSVVMCGLILSSCHSSAKKEVALNTAPAVVQPVNPNVKAKAPQGPFPSFVILDTIVGRDTIKFVMYDDSLAKCTINGLSDICNSGGIFEHWDSSFGDYGIMMVPGRKKLQRLILNDSILIVPVSYGYMRMMGGVALYLINRTKHSIKFASANNDNPLRIGSEEPYVDIKTNQIIDYYYHVLLNDQDAGDQGEEHGRYMTYRARILNRQFKRTDEDAIGSKEIENLELFDPGDSDLRAFYTILAHHENWQRDRYDSSNIQRITAMDSTVGNAKIKIWYDNQGNVICKVNGKFDSTGWDDTWLGYEWWRKKMAKRIIIPGEKKPRSFVLNDSLLLFSLLNSDGRAVVFVFERRRTNLDSNIVNTFANYVYVDLKRNRILSYEDTDYRVDLREGATPYPHDNDSLYLVDRFTIHKDVVLQENTYRCIFKGEYPVAPVSYKANLDFYTRIIQSKNLNHDTYNSKSH